MKEYIDNDGAPKDSESYSYAQYLEDRRIVEEKYFRSMGVSKNNTPEEHNLVNEDEEIIQEPYWYLATVYTSYPKGLEHAYLDACKMEALCLENGIYVFCPIAHTHTASKNMDLNKYTHDFWMKFDYALLYPAKGLIVTMMDNWKNSKGINLEINYMKKLGKPIIYTNFMEVPKIG